MMDNGNLRLRARHPQSHQGVCADAVASLEGITRQDVDATGSGEPEAGGRKRSPAGHFDKEPGVRSIARTAALRSTVRNIRVRKPRIEGLAGR